MSGRQVAVIGMCDFNRMNAPWEDRDWQVWALGWDEPPRYDRLFEVHPRRHWEPQVYRMGHYRTLTVPIYMEEAHADIPTSVRYPLEEAAALVGLNNQGKPFLESSVAMMFALAMLEGAAKIGLWGVDMESEGQHAYQKPNMLYLIGLARGRGIKVFVPGESALFSSAWHRGYYGAMDPKYRWGPMVPERLPAEAAV